MRITTRPAAKEDLEAIVELTRQRRGELARWEPVYWNPRAGVDDLHPHFLRYCIDQATIEVHVAVESDHVVGCAILQPQNEQWFLDDLCVVNEQWSVVGEALAGSFHVSPTITCCPRRDESQSRWLAKRGAVRVSEYHSIDLRAWPQPSDEPRIAQAEPTPPRGLPVHTFVNGRLNPATSGALVLRGDDGDLIGTPSVSPPTYDPGGPTTVFERVNGRDPAALLRIAIEACATRGDAQIVVVCAADDYPLHRLLETAGSSIPVDVWRL